MGKMKSHDIFYLAQYYQNQQKVINTGSLFFSHQFFEI